MKIKKHNDWILILVLLLLALLALLVINSTKLTGSIVVVTLDGEEILRLPLSDDHTERIEQAGNYNVLVIEDESVQIRQANCANQLCVQHKAISYQGETIICAPHKLLVQIFGNSEEIDSVSY